MYFYTIKTALILTGKFLLMVRTLTSGIYCIFAPSSVIGIFPGKQQNLGGWKEGGSCEKRLSCSCSFPLPICVTAALSFVGEDCTRRAALVSPGGEAGSSALSSSSSSPRRGRTSSSLNLRTHSLRFRRPPGPGAPAAGSKAQHKKESTPSFYDLNQFENSAF